MIGKRALALVGAPVETSQDALPREELLHWLRHWTEGNRGKRRCVAFTLARMLSAGSAPTDDAEPVTHVEAPSASACEADRERVLGEAADELLRGAQALASVVGMRTAYVVCGHEAAPKLDNGDEGDPIKVPPRVTFPFSVTPPPGVRENFEGGEEATDKGGFATIQRHGDTALRESHRSLNKGNELLLEMNRDLMKHIERLREIDNQRDSQLQDALDRKTTRDLQVMNGKFDLALKEQVAEIVFEQVIPVATLIAKSKLGVVPAVPAEGAPVLAGKAGPSAQPDLAPVEASDPGALLAYVRSLKLKPAQLVKFVAMLDDDQRKQIGQLVYHLQRDMGPEERAALVAGLEEASAQEAAAKAARENGSAL